MPRATYELEQAGALDGRQFELAIRRLADGLAYGTVVATDPMYSFHVGEPRPAYQIRLAQNGKTIWLAKAMVGEAFEAE